MSCLRSFIDVLFILLIGAIVMLSNSVQLGTVDAVPAHVDEEGFDRVSPDKVRVVIVQAHELSFEGTSHSTPESMISILPPDEQILLVSGREDLRHHRMMAVWSDFNRLGRSVQIGVEPKSSEESDDLRESISSPAGNEE